MSNITIACICLAIFSVCSVICGIILLVSEILDYKKHKDQNKHPVWFHSVDIRSEVERITQDKEE